MSTGIAFHSYWPYRTAFIPVEDFDCIGRGRKSATILDNQEARSECPFAEFLFKLLPRNLRGNKFVVEFVVLDGDDVFDLAAYFKDGCVRVGHPDYIQRQSGSSEFPYSIIGLMVVVAE